MFVLRVRGVNEAYAEGLAYILGQGEHRQSRAGAVFALDHPLAVVYALPQERVLFAPVRDANPFFHLFEALWLLAGRRDARWLDRFIGDFSSRFAEADGTLHGSYGFRWRRHFDLDGEGNPNMPDQLNTVVRLLKANPDDRRVVIQMWDPVSDLGQDFKDVPCNLTVVPRIRWGGMNIPLLDITVFNRSNDLVWGLAGANAVQFSMLQEYLAGRIGVGVGRYTQISTNAHVYPSTVPDDSEEGPDSWGKGERYPKIIPMGTNWEKWDDDLRNFMNWVALSTAKELYPLAFPSPQYANSWFDVVATRLFVAHSLWKSGNREHALKYLREGEQADWHIAAGAWMERRLARMTERQELVR